MQSVRVIGKELHRQKIHRHKLTTDDKCDGSAACSAVSHVLSVCCLLVFAIIIIIYIFAFQAIIHEQNLAIQAHKINFSLGATDYSNELLDSIKFHVFRI